MYESPINVVVSELCNEIQKRDDKYIMECVHNVGINVDNDELLKALAYDRKQYDKGYNDGYKDRFNEVLNKIRAEIETDLSNFCFDDWGNETNEWKEVKAIIDKYRAESENKK